LARRVRQNRRTRNTKRSEVTQWVNHRTNENRGGAVVQGNYARENKILRVGAHSDMTGRVLGEPKKILAQVPILVIHEIPGYIETNRSSRIDQQSPSSSIRSRGLDDVGTREEEGFFDTGTSCGDDQDAPRKLGGSLKGFIEDILEREIDLQGIVRSRQNIRAL